MSQYHTPVLLEESVGLLAIEPAGTYADLTFGGGGHSRRILSDLGPEGRLYGFDQDRDTLENRPDDARFHYVESNFRFLRGALRLPFVEVAAPLLGYAGNGGNMGLWGVCAWNAYGTFYDYSGFVGSLVLAYYLVRYPLRWSWRRTLGVMAPLVAVGYLITALGFVATQNRLPGNFAYLEIVWYFCGINGFMMTLPVFVVVQKLAVAARPWLSRLASLTFGI